jgi:equilibrative nucleoside transporter 1/2/3
MGSPLPKDIGDTCASDETKQLSEAYLGAENCAEMSLYNQLQFSWLDYWLCFAVGVGMLWTWFVFSSDPTQTSLSDHTHRQAIIGAGPYLQYRFKPSPQIVDRFESTLFSVFSATELFMIAALSKFRNKARYCLRTNISLGIYVLVSCTIAISTIFFVSVPVKIYFAFLLVSSGGIGISNALSQNGVYALVSGFGEPRYTQAVMFGSAFAGIMPPISRK